MTGLRSAWVVVVVLAVALSPTAALPAGSQDVKVPIGRGHELPGTLFTPSASGPIPGVLVLHTRGGLQQADVSYAADLAQAGFVSLVVSYYPSPKYDPRLLQHPGFIDDLARAVDYLQARPELQGKPVGIVGFSLGSKGISVAARHPGVKAVVSYYGVYDLRTLPQTKGWKSYPPMPVDIAARVEAPVLLLHGALDDETPLSQAESMRDALVRAGKVVELMVYPQATHAFDRGLSRAIAGDKSREGYTYRLDPHATKDAWNRILAWFGKYLRP